MKFYSFLGCGLNLSVSGCVPVVDICEFDIAISDSMNNLNKIYQEKHTRFR
jgi:hypothetical protein